VLAIPAPDKESSSMRLSGKPAAMLYILLLIAIYILFIAIWGTNAELFVYITVTIPGAVLALIFWIIFARPLE
jgi:hypothetical protein